MSALRVCDQCRVNEGTERWGDVMTQLHGGGQMWCVGCVLEAQIEHAQERANMLPDLRRQLAEFRAASA